MRAPVVHHAAYVTPLPAAHRFPMPKFRHLLACLRETGLLLPIQEFMPEPAPCAWLELAHSSDYVSACSSSDWMQWRSAASAYHYRRNWPSATAVRWRAPS